jgi:Ca2+-binding EF-hand superfamily protein
VTGNNDGEVTLQEFTSYYEDVGGSIDSDEYFVMMVESAWGVQESDNYVTERWAEIKETVAQKCAQKCSEGANEAEKCKKIMKNFDDDETDSLSRAQFVKASERLGFPPDMRESDLQIIFENSELDGEGKLKITSFSQAVTKSA